ncbi:hypothetical protein [Pseudarthrobacter sp. N5]|uniref:hypothetical protein n=1 Tax=Pseudarthrobacter sp. N5 TaxID=3418416 RepID=UPI003CFA1A11
MAEHAQVPVRKKGNWGAKIIVVLVALLIVVIAYFALASILPVWWANVIRNQVQGNLGAGILVGMFYGFEFTFVPLLVVWQATHKAVKWGWKIVIVLLAVALATPNPMTAGILITNSEAAHNGQRIFGTEPTWFPMWTQVSATAAFVIFVASVILWTIWCGRGKKMKALKQPEAERVKAAKQAGKEAKDAGRPTSGLAAIFDDAKTRVVDIFDPKPVLDGRADNN